MHDTYDCQVRCEGENARLEDFIEIASSRVIHKLQRFAKLIHQWCCHQAANIS